MQATLGMSGSGTGGANGSVSLMSQLWCNNDVSLNPFSTGTHFLYLFCLLFGDIRFQKFMWRLK